MISFAKIPRSLKVSIRRQFVIFCEYELIGILEVKSPEVQEELLYYPHVAVMQRRVEEFININSLQGECAQFLRYLVGDANSIPLLQKVMDDEYLLNVNTAVETASAVVMGRVQKAREEMPAEFGPSMERRLPL